MKIILLIKGLGLGGAERHVVDCAVELRRCGHEVTIAYLLPHKNALVNELAEESVPVICLGGRFWWLSCLPLWVKLLASFRPDCVHAHLPVAGILARLVKPFYSYSLIYTEHNVYPRLNPVTRFFHRLTHPMDDVSISCSAAVAESLPWPSKVVENGIRVCDTLTPVSGQGEIRAKLGLGQDSTIFVCVANLLPKKNHVLLLRAFEEAFSDTEGVDAHLVLIGQDGSERRALEEFSGRLQTGSRVHFWGPDPRASHLLQDSDVFCLSSAFEGLPVALLESMAAGIPAVVTRVGGMGAGVVHGATGFVVEPDDCSAYADALHRLCADAALRSNMGANAHQRVREHYSQAHMIEKLIECYQQ